MSTTFAKETMLSDQQIKNLISKRIFFGHQSVGDNLVQGIRELMSEDSRLQLNIVASAEPQSVTGCALIEAHVGTNRNPQSKTDAFFAIVNKGLEAQGGIALYKYCYIDFNSSTDVQAIFDSHRRAIASLQQKYPSLKFVHCTVPLTIDEPSRGLKDQIKTILRRALGRDPHIKRNQFNRLLRSAYGRKEPVFDLAEIESTRPDGSRCYFMHGAQRIYTLVPEFTTDGGHLNEIGRRTAAEQFLALLAGL